MFCLFLIFFLADFCCCVFTSLFSGGLSTELIAAVIVAVAAGGHGYEAWKATVFESSTDSQHDAKIALFSIIFIAHARQHDAAKPVFVPCPLKWHKFQAFSCLAASLLPDRPLFGANCLHAAWSHQVDFLNIFFRMLAAQGQTTNAQAIRISRNICWKKRLNITKYLNSARMIRLIFSCATDLGFFPIFSEFFRTSPGCAGGLVVGISDPSDPSKIGPWQLKWSNWTSK